jgi:hypothetical protein
MPTGSDMRRKIGGNAAAMTRSVTEITRGRSGFSRSYGTLEAYRNNYRAGFRAGYDAGFRDDTGKRR